MNEDYFIDIIQNNKWIHKKSKISWTLLRTTKPTNKQKRWLTYAVQHHRPVGPFRQFPILAPVGLHMRIRNWPSYWVDSPEFFKFDVFSRFSNFDFFLPASWSTLRAKFMPVAQKNHSKMKHFSRGTWSLSLKAIFNTFPPTVRSMQPKFCI